MRWWWQSLDDHEKVGVIGWALAALWLVADTIGTLR